MLPLIFWLAGQSGVILLADLRVSLWAQTPAASELLALHYLLIFQVVGSIHFLSIICCRLDLALVLLASVWPFTILAGMLASVDLITMARAGIVASIWIGALTGLAWAIRVTMRSPLSPTRWAFWLTGVLFTWCIAGPLLRFLGAEYPASPLSPLHGIARIALGPLEGAIWALSETKTSVAPFASLLLPLIPAGLAVAFSALRRRHPGP